MLRETTKAKTTTERLSEYMASKNYTARKLSVSLCGGGCYEGVINRLIKGDYSNKGKINTFKRLMKKYHDVDL